MPKTNCCQTLVTFVVVYVLGPFVILPLGLFVAPFGRLYNWWLFNWFQNRFVSTRSEHRKKVSKVQDQVKKWHAAGRTPRMCTGRPAWTSFSIHGMDKRVLSQIQIGDLNCIVEVDTVQRAVTVEPGMMMGQLSTILISRGWTIPVIPEFESLTVGGVICGTGVESGSARHGLSGDTAIEYEVVLSTGEVVTCSKDERSDLFYSIPWSHGTLGFLMAVKFPLIPAKKYVQLEYHPTTSLAEAQRLLHSPDHEFVEGIAYGRRKFVVTLGNMTDLADSKRGPVNHINRWYKQFFYKHVETFLGKRPRKKGGPYVEYYPLRDYYHRHMRGYFWTIPLILPYGNSVLFRYLFGWVFPGNAKVGKRISLIFGPRLQEMAMQLMVSNYVLQDFLIPLKDLEASLDFFHDLVEVYPLWICPVKFSKKPGMAHCSRGENDPETELYFDLGVYGNVGKSKEASYRLEQTTEEMEDFVMNLQGYQFLYADSFLSREEFRRMFDMDLYDQVRVKYQAADAFPEVYDKVSKHARKIAQV